MKLIRFFRGAGATGHVFLLANGKTIDKGLAYSGYVGPWTTIAVVPMSTRIIPFSVPAKTKDRQPVVVVGEIELELDPNKAISCLDFTVNDSGNHTGDWERTLQSLAMGKIIDPAVQEMNKHEIREAVVTTVQTAAVLKDALNAGDSLQKSGIIVKSVSVAKIEPGEAELGKALGAEQREKILSTADKARHDRQIDAAKNNRTLQEYEIETQKTIEVKRAELLTQQIANEKAKADADAINKTTGLAVYETIPAAKLLALGIMQFAEGGNVGTLNISPDLLNAVKAAAGEN